MRRIIRLPSDPLSRASFADPLDIIDTDSFCSGSSPSSGNLPPVGEETLTYRNDPDEEEGTDGIDDKTKEGESLRIGRPEKTRRRIISDDDDEDISPEGGRKRMKVASSTIDQPSYLQNVALSPTSAVIFMDSPTQAASPSAGSSPFSSSPFISLVPPGLTGIETDIVERPDSLQQEGSTLEAMRSSGLPTPPATSAPIAAPEVTLPTEQPPGEMGDHDTDLIENSTNTPGLVENEGVEDEDMDPDQSDGHGKAQSIPPQSPAKLESNAKPDNPVSEDISEGVFPTKMITAEEGEDEIDLDDEPQEMDVDPPEATPAPADTETTRDDSAPSSVPKPIAKSQKNKSGAATGAEKKIKAKSAIQTKVGARQPGKGKGKTKVNDLKSESSKPRSVSVSESAHASASAVSSEVPAHREESIDPEDTAVYCICQKPYNEEDEDVVMVGCDACDNWFHPGCVGISKEQLELLDVYICESCERSTAQRTVYKLVCKRDGCVKSFTGRQSKFCSSSCAFRHSHAIVSATPNKKTLKQLANAFMSYPAPTSDVTVIHHTTDPFNYSPIPDSNVLVLLHQQIEATTATIEIVVKRQRILQQAIARCETLSVPAGLPNGDGGQSKKTKSKGPRTGSDDRPCGWERRLIWSDEDLRPWDGDPGEEVGCPLPRRRCDRHQGWQKTMTVSLDVEAAQLNRRHRSLISQRDQLSQSLDASNAAARARDAFRSKTAARIPQTSS